MIIRPGAEVIPAGTVAKNPNPAKRNEAIDLDAFEEVAGGLGFVIANSPNYRNLQGDESLL